jgi:hypothetical protein
MLIYSNLFLFAVEFLAIAIGIKTYFIDRERNKESGVVIAYFTFSLLQVLTFSLFPDRVVSNTMYYLFLLMELVTYSFLFSKVLGRFRIPILSMGLIIASALLAHFAINGSTYYHTLYVISIDVFFLFWYAFYFFGLINSDQSLSISRNRLFWILSGMLVYIGGSFPLYVYEFLSGKNINREFHWVNNFLYIILLLFVIKAFKTRK